MLSFGLGEIDRYLLRRSLVGVLIALAIIAMIILLLSYVELSRTVGTSATEISAAVLLGLALLQTPTIVLMLLPFAFLFGVLGAYVNLNRRNELIALRAAGVSAWRFILPGALVAALWGVVTIISLNPIAAKMSDQFQRLESRLMASSSGGNAKPIWIRQGDRRQQIIIEAARKNGAGVDLRDVKLFIYRVEADGSLQFSNRFDADLAELGAGRWTLFNVREGKPGQIAQQYSAITIPSPLNAKTALERYSSPTAVPFWSLPGLISRTERSGFSATGYRIQFQQLLATPLMFAAMTVLGAAFSLRLLRLGGLSGLAGSGVVLGFGCFFLNQLCVAFGRGGVIPPFVAGWAPPTLAMLAGLTLLCYTEDG